MKRSIGFIILIAVVLTAAIIGYVNRSKTGGADNLIVLNGYVGGEKMDFLKDEEVINILKRKYGIELKYNKRGSIEMVTQDISGQDFLWPSSQVALEMFKESRGIMAGSEIIFNSPIVLYSWKETTDTLINAKIVEQREGSYYVIDFPKLIELCETNKRWSELGLTKIDRPIAIFSTDPAKSNSGNMFAGLLADVMNNNSVPDEAALVKLLPRIKRFFDTQGLMPDSSGDMFKQYVVRGIGDKQIIVGYESQILEYGVLDQTAPKRSLEQICILYPKPTVWSSHPLIALNDNAKKLITALQDKDIQKIAWQRHGFRSGSGADNDVNVFQGKGLAPSIDDVVQMPSPKVMNIITKAVSE